MILERYVGLMQLGIYTLGYQFGQAYQAIVTSINNAMIPMFGRASNKAEEYQLLSRATTYYLLAITAIALAVALLGGEVILFVFPTNYHGAAPIVLWVVLGYLAFGAYYIPMNFLAMTAGQTRAIPLASITAAGANVALNLWLVPRLGPIAAAINTAIAYGLLAVSMFFLASLSGTLPIEHDRVGKVALSTILLYLAGRISMRFHPIVNIIIGLNLTLALPFLLHLLKFWKEDEKIRIRRYFARLATVLNRQLE